MIRAVENYLAARHAAGFELKSQCYLVRSFARFAAARGETHIRTTTAIDWASRTVSVAQRDARLKAVCRLARYLRAEDSQHELPPPRHFGYRKIRPLPHIYPREEIQRLMDAARKLEPPHSLPAQTFVTLLGLLAATGLRISEALNLQLSDVTPTNGLLIRKTKFQKTRLVPLHHTVATHMERYLRSRWQARTSRQEVFIDDDYQPLRYWEVHRTFQKVLKMAGLSPSGGRRYRLHHLRHTFAVRALEASPPGRQRIGQHMLALATYMGHVNIYSTYWYLQTTPELLRGIAVAGEAFLYGGHA
jgi:integrase/recombinase XerD